ncbi:MAG: hypothetical protein PHU23_10075 [Dehalococcoidales bacterium]|nr:hypothetical protein [Dehalococcoidales bacterium]
MDIQQKATEYNRCKALKRNGQPCQARALKASEFCFSHDPALSEKRDQARKAGGKNSAKIARLRSLIPPRLVSVYDALEKALKEVHDGTLEPGKATAMATVARAMVSVLTGGELEERVRKIEESIGEG